NTKPTLTISGGHTNDIKRAAAATANDADVDVDADADELLLTIVDDSL
ncbi:hypothetical protein Tco_0690909, partial [Tanacetum coccineum]